MPRFGASNQRRQATSISLQQSAATSASQALVDLRPVHDIEPGADVVGAAILVLEIIGVFPDVNPEQRSLALHDRAVLIRCAFNRQLAAAGDHPGPAAAEPADASLGEL